MAGLLPEVFWGLTWCEYDALLFNHRYREQQMLAGHRAVAAQLYNIAQGFQKYPRSKSPAEYWELPLIDPAPVPSKPVDEAWWEKMRGLAERSGKRFAVVND